MELTVPPNVEVVNGHWMCFRDDSVLVDLYTPNEGFWGFYLQEADARRTAQVVCGGVCINCGCETRHHDNEVTSCDKCYECAGLLSDLTRHSAVPTGEI